MELNPENAKFEMEMKADLLLLREQKHLLLLAMTRLGRIKCKNDKHKKEIEMEVDALEGILNFLDFIQDQAVDVGGYDKNDVYLFSKDNE